MTEVSNEFKKTITSRLIFEESSAKPFSFAPSYFIFSNTDGYFHMTDIDLADERAVVFFVGSNLQSTISGKIDTVKRSVDNPDPNRFPHKIVGTLNRNPLHPRVKKFPGGTGVLKIFHITREFIPDLERPFSLISLDPISAYEFNRQRVPVFDEDNKVVGSVPFVPSKMHLFNKNGKQLLVADLLVRDISNILFDRNIKNLIYIVYARG